MSPHLEGGGYGIFFAILAILVRLAFWIYTDRVWEDALITVLNSENAVGGLGLTHYNIGQPPIHGFTSPISVLIPLIGDSIHVGFGLSLLKIVSLMLGGIAVIYMTLFAIHPKINLPVPLAVLLMGYAAFEPQQISFGMAGLETQIATTVVLAFLYYVMVWRPLAIGLSLGIAVLTRPEFILLVPILAAVSYFRRKNIARGEIIKTFVPALVIYLPWIIFTTLYYGSPVPNSIPAKMIGYGLWITNPDMSLFSKIASAFLLSKNTLFTYLSPAFAGHGTGYAPMFDKHLISMTMTFFALVEVLVIFKRREIHLLGYALFLLFYSFFYLFVTPALFSWYPVPFSAVVVILSVLGIQFVYRRFHFRSLKLLWAGSLIYISIFIAMIPLTFEAQRGIQKDIEDKVRKQIGLYLQTVMRMDESVGTESLGYIGYYSRRTVFDWPGLGNRQVAEYAKTLPRSQRNMQNMWKHFKPDYLVVRPSEYEKLKIKNGEDNFIDKNYVLVKTFEADPAKVKQIPYYWMNIDTKFLVFRKITKI